MAGTTLSFVLQGRDALSRVLNSASDAADRLKRRLDDAANESARSLAGFTRDSDGRLRDLQGRFISAEDAAARLRQGIGNMRDPFEQTSKKAKALGEEIKGSLISLAPAAIPAAAGLAGAAAAVAAQLGGAAVAAGAFGLALKPQMAEISNAVKAHDTYQDAVKTSGASSQDAAKAQLAYTQELSKLPPATQRAAVGVSQLKDNYQKWSDALAGDVMAPFNKGIAIANDLLPKTSGLVKGASGQFDRLVTLVGGAVESPGFDALNDRFTKFSTGALRKAIDSVVEFLAKLDTGKVGGSIQEFLDYAHAQGPVVGDTLRNVGEAIAHILQAGSDVGVSMLDLINALSNIVAAVPPGAISAMLQMAVAIKAVKLAAAGAGVAKSALAGIAAQIGVMRATSMGTPGALAGVTAAIGNLSRGAKIAMAGTGIGLLLIALDTISSHGKAAAPDVDKLTTSLGELGRTGKATGYVASLFGDDFKKLREEIQKVIDPSVAEGVNNWGAKITGGLLSAGDSTEKFTKDVGAVDDGLANLVSNGKADLAKAALAAFLKGMDHEQVTKFTGELDDYKSALAAQALEQQLTAQSMGLFGQQALDTQTKLDAQKKSADGLRQSIQALNEVNRSALDAQSDLEAAIDAASDAAKANGKVLHTTNGEIDLGSKKARDAYGALSDLASKTDAATAAARDNGESWDKVNATYDKGRTKLIEAAQKMGLNRTEANKLADAILGIPASRTSEVRGKITDLQNKIDAAKKELKSVPPSKQAEIKARISQLQAQLKTAQGTVNSLHGKTVDVYVQEHIRAAAGRDSVLSGSYGHAQGGYVSGPGTGTSDSILARLSNGEYVIPAARVQQYGRAMFDAIRNGKLTGSHAAPAGRVPAGRPAIAGPSTPTPAATAPTVINMYGAKQSAAEQRADLVRQLQFVG